MGAQPGDAGGTDDSPRDVPRGEQGTRPSEVGGERRRGWRRGWRSARHTAWRLLTSTVGSAFRYRVTGLAAEAAFFAILSMPPLVFALAGSIGFFVERYDVAQVATLRADILAIAAQALTDEAVDTVVADTLDDVLSRGRFDVISIGFVLALWSGSRALNVFVDTITIMYGLAGRRGIVGTRLLSFSLYVVGLVVAVVVLPLVLIGPELLADLLPVQLSGLIRLYWPTVIVLSVAFIASLYHLSVPVRTSWRHDLPGAAFALTMWIVGSYLLRWVLQNAVGGTSIYGPLAAPIAVLIWLYLISLAVLIGAAVNASFDRVWPESATASARQELVRRLRRSAWFDRLRGGDPDDPEQVAGTDDADAGEGATAKPGAAGRRRP